MSSGRVPQGLLSLLGNRLDDEVLREIRKSLTVFCDLNAYGMAACFPDDLIYGPLRAGALAVNLPGENAPFFIDAGIGAEGGERAYRAV